MHAALSKLSCRTPCRSIGKSGNPLALGARDSRFESEYSELDNYPMRFGAARSADRDRPLRISLWCMPIQVIEKEVVSTRTLSPRTVVKRR